LEAARRGKELAVKENPANGKGIPWRKEKGASGKRLTEPAPKSFTSVDNEGSALRAERERRSGNAPNRGEDEGAR